MERSLDNHILAPPPGGLDPVYLSGSREKYQVPKSHSSSSGVNEISDSVSSTNSKEDLNSKHEKLTGAADDIPTFNDVLDLLKFSYILQVSFNLTLNST